MQVEIVELIRRGILRLIALLIFILAACDQFDCTYNYPIVNPRRAVESLAAARNTFGVPLRVTPLSLFKEELGRLKRGDQSLASELASYPSNTIDVYYWEHRCLGRTRERMWIFVVRPTGKIVAISVQQVIS